MESFAEQGLKQTAAGWQEELAHASDRVSEFTLAHKDKLEQAKKTVDNYVTKELVQDIPTGKLDPHYSLYWGKACFNSVGMTPQRRQFHYPSDLICTRPHSELLEEFRSAQEAVMTLPQLPESDSELETNSTSVSTIKTTLLVLCRVLPTLVGSGRPQPPLSHFYHHSKSVKSAEMLYLMRFDNTLSKVQPLLRYSWGGLCNG